MFGSELSYTRWDHCLSLTVWGIISPVFLSLQCSGADPGGGVRIILFGDPQLHKEGKKRRVHACECNPF